MTNIIKVKQGDTLSKIAKDNNTTVNELVKINNIKDPNLIFVDQDIELPSNDEEMDFSSYISNVEEAPVEAEKFTGREDIDESSSHEEVVEEVTPIEEKEMYTGREDIDETTSSEDVIETVDDIEVEELDEIFDEDEEYIDEENEEVIEEIEEPFEEEVIEEVPVEGTPKDNNYDPSERLLNLRNSLPNSSDYYSSGRCGALARETLETLGVIKSGYGANGVDYARNLANNPEAAADGYSIKGYEINGNQEQVFDGIVAENNGSLSNLVISFNSQGHYRHSQQYGHVITITDIKDDKVYLIDTYDTRGNRWAKETTPIEMGMDEFKSMYITNENSVNYITHIK